MIPEKVALKFTWLKSHVENKVNLLLFTVNKEHYCSMSHKLNACVLKKNTQKSIQ